MSFWSGQRLARNKHLISDFNESQIDCAAYNLRVGNCYYCTSEEDDHYQTKRILGEGETFVIPPGQFAFLITKEEVYVPDNAIAFISMKTGLKFQGLINVSGFHVDPGYKGNLVYSVFNAGPTNISITAGERIFKIWFSDLDDTSEKKFLYSGKSASITNELIKGMSMQVLSLRDLSKKLRNVEEKQIEQKTVLDNLNFIYRGLIVALLVGTILAYLNHAFKL